MSKPDSDYTPHAICLGGLLMGIWMTKHGAEEVAELVYKHRGYVIVKATHEHYSIMKAMH